jgi:hypothetical protein
MCLFVLAIGNSSIYMSQPGISDAKKEKKALGRLKPETWLFV